jgi:hypothetical protein
LLAFAALSLSESAMAALSCSSSSCEHSESEHLVRSKTRASSEVYDERL